MHPSIFKLKSLHFFRLKLTEGKKESKGSIYDTENNEYFLVNLLLLHIWCHGILQKVLWTFDTILEIYNDSVR